MRATVFVNRTGAHQIRWCGALAEGLRRHGIDTTLANRGDDDNGADIVAMWSVRNKGAIQRAKGRGATVAILEAAFVDRLENMAISFGGGLNGRGIFAPAGDNGERFRKRWGHHLKPWTCVDGYALICGQVPGDMAVEDVDLKTVYANAAEECRKLGFEPVFRPHPKGSPPAPDGCRVLSGSLAENLAGAAFAVSWNSNTGVDAAMAGVPVVALDRGSMAYEVASPVVAPPWRPDRNAWAAALAWKQWSIDEIRSGFAWEHLGPVV